MTDQRLLYALKIMKVVLVGEKFGVISLAFALNTAPASLTL
jgi:hypothetical protein